MASINAEVPDDPSFAIEALGRPVDNASLVCPETGADPRVADAARTAAPPAEITSMPR
jgi:hypothetical protein